MLITDLSKDIALILPALILVEGVIGLIAWFALGSRGGRGARIAAWLGLVTLTLWCGSAAAFVLLNVIYFALGSAAAIAAAIVITLAMIAMPFGWALVIRHHAANNPAEAASQPR
jgi:hypothetical protein